MTTVTKTGSQVPFKRATPLMPALDAPWGTPAAINITLLAELDLHSGNPIPVGPVPARCGRGVKNAG
jgi:hypothetical protein